MLDVVEAALPHLDAPLLAAHKIEFRLDAGLLAADPIQ
jgi:hypothetical protein